MMETWQWWLVALGIIGILGTVAYGYYYYYWSRTPPSPESTMDPEHCNPSGIVHLDKKPTEDPPCSLFMPTQLSAPPPQFFLGQNRWNTNQSISPSSLERQQHLTKENHRFLSLSPFLGQQPSPSPVSTAHHSVQTRTPSPGRWSSWKRHS